MVRIKEDMEFIMSMKVLVMLEVRVCVKERDSTFKRETVDSGAQFLESDGFCLLITEGCWRPHVWFHCPWCRSAAGWLSVKEKTSPLFAE